MLNYSGSGIETTFTQGEDACLASLVPSLPAGSADAAPSLLVVGALADVVEDQFARLFDAAGHRPGALLPAAPRRRPAGGRPEHARSCWRSPSWPTPRARSKSAAHAAAGALPARRRRHDARGCRPRRDAFGVDAGRFERVTAPGRERARTALSRVTARTLAGKRVFFFPDSQLEIPIARFLAREARHAADRSRHALPAPPAPGRGTRAAARRHACCPKARTSRRQLDRCRAARAGHRGLRPRPRQPAGGRGHDHQVVDRAGVHADPGLRAGRRPGRAVRAAAAAPRCAYARLDGADAMQLTLWTYEGPPHVGAMRIATAMEDVHYVLHAPQGDTYADLLFTMIERLPKRPPVTYTTFQARDLGGDTAELFKTRRARRLRALPAAGDAGRRLVHRRADPGRSRAASPRALDLPMPVVALELPSYQRKENWGAAETFYQLVRALAGPNAPHRHGHRARARDGQRPRCNLLGPTALGFRHRDDVREITRLLEPHRHRRPRGRAAGRHRRPTWPACGEADFNVVLYPEIAALDRQLAATRTFGQPFDQDRPDRRRRHARLHRRGRRARRHRRRPPRWPRPTSRAPWYSRSVDSTYLTGKRVFVFGDATHADRGGARRRRASSASRSSASAPTAASSRARCARPPSSTASRR